MIDRVVAVYKELFGEITIVTNNPVRYRQFGMRLFDDAIPDMGSLGGIYTGLLKSAAERCFVAACDMPFLNAALIARMVEISSGGDVLIAKLNEGMEPLHAVYSKACIEPISELLSKGDLKIINFFPKVKVVEISEEEVRKFDPELLSFLNINTWADLKRAEELLGLHSL